MTVGFPDQQQLMERHSSIEGPGAGVIVLLTCLEDFLDILFEKTGRRIVPGDPDRLKREMLVMVMGPTAILFRYLPLQEGFA